MADSNSIYCPQCHKHTGVTKRADYLWPKDHNMRYEIAECNSCDFFLLIQRWGGTVLTIYPNPLPKPIHEKTPDFLTTDLREAHDCFSVGAYRGAVILARRALQACCFEKGAPDKRLNEQIDWLLSKQIITNDLKNWAHEVKATGNDAAHPPKDPATDTTVEKEDAEEILTLLEKFIDILYIAPALAEERRHKRV